MLRYLLNFSFFLALTIYVSVTSSDIGSVLDSELQSNGNPFKATNSSPDFIRRSIASVSAKKFAKSFDRRAVQDLQVVKSYEENLAKLSQCLKKVCSEVFEQDDVSGNYELYEKVIITKVSQQVNELFHFSIKKGYKGHSVVTSVSDFSNIRDTALMTNIVLLLSSQDQDKRSLNMLIGMTRMNKNTELKNLIFGELRRYSKNKKFKEVLSDQLVSLFRNSTNNSNYTLNQELYEFIDKDNYRKFNGLLTSIPNDTQMYSNIVSQIKKAKANL